MISVRTYVANSRMGLLFTRAVRGNIHQLPLLAQMGRGGACRSLWIPVILLSLVAAFPEAAEGSARLLDGFDDASAWSVGSSEDVQASLHADRGALCLDFDFGQVSGYAFLRRDLPLRFSGNFAISLRLRGPSPDISLQVKLIDAAGDNVWWINRPNLAPGRDWQTIRTERRRIAFAWGPAKDHTLRRTETVEITVVAGKGSRGRICFDDLMFEPLPSPPSQWPQPAVRASSELPDAPAVQALDGDRATLWSSEPGGDVRQWFEIDFRTPRPFGGLVLHWAPGREAGRYAVEFSDDGRVWRTVRHVSEGNGGEDPLLLTDSRTRFLRLVLEEGPAPAYSLSEIDVMDLAWGATANGFFLRMAQNAPRGFYPRGFSGEQSYWTIVGVDGGGKNCALVSEDGAVELGRGGFSVEPFLIADTRFISWADATISQGLADGYLPMPRVDWQAAGLKLHIEAFADGSPGDAYLLVRYTVENHTDDSRRVTLALAVRPFQVNPPTQSLNGPGGVHRIYKLDWNGNELVVDGLPRVFPLHRPDAFSAGSFDSGGVIAMLEAGKYAPVSRLADESGFASGAMLFHLALSPRGRRSIDVLAPLAGTPLIPDAARQDPDGWTVRRRDRVAMQWRERLNQITLQLPSTAKAIADTLRTSLAYILISRDGPALQPGTRAYARTWIRDGAMMSEALLRMGQSDVVHDFIAWFAPHQFSSGKTPCCVDARGADPVPENDSPGELIFTVAELYRFTHKISMLETLWPYVRRAVEYMERLRARERTSANRSPARRALYGLMPASISHEGYAAKPMHSYWDDFWALRGYEDAVDLARALGKTGEAERLTHFRDEFRNDLIASIRAAVQQHDIDYLPGAAELGDFDATSTTIALSPGRGQTWLPPALLQNTFARYWQKFVARRDGQAGYEYTPYELRTVAAFIRLGQRGRVLPLLDFFMADRRPEAWNGWAEVVRRDPRKPGFIGDMPHAWIASDYIRSVLDAFAYRQPGEKVSMVLAAGVPISWLQEGGIGISGLKTPWGSLSYALHREEDRLWLHLDAEMSPPGGFILKWPYVDQPGETRIDGRKASWRGEGLHIPVSRAEVTIQLPVSGR